jgi:hypothetical protein
MTTPQRTKPATCEKCGRPIRYNAFLSKFWCDSEGCPLRSWAPEEVLPTPSQPERPRQPTPTTAPAKCGRGGRDL